jgi:Na+/melibiose symporter-like transporter
LRLQLRLSFGSAGLAEGIVRHGLSSFVMIYYSQVLGLPAQYAGFAIGVGIFVDAVSDPLVGWWSDRSRSRLGRRHPFIYGSIVPLALTYYLLWNPPADWLSERDLFAYLLVLSVSIRLAHTFFFIPLIALAPEVTRDYDERTALMNNWVASSFFFGTLMTVAMYGYWLRDSPEHPVGILRASGYAEYGLVAGLAILLAAAVAAVGTQRAVPAMQLPPPPALGSLRKVSGQIRQTLSDSSVVAIIVAAILNGTAGGAGNALWIYLMSYYWEFESGQLSALMALVLVCPPIAYAVTPLATRRHNKRNVQAFVGTASLVFYATPYALRSVGLFPGNEHPALFPLLVASALIVGIVDTVWSTVNYSMVADLVEAREIETGRREEGVLAATRLLAGKASTALGAVVGGFALYLIDFPVQTAVGEVPEKAIYAIGLIYGPITGVLYGAAVAVLYFYRIDRKSHQATLSKLAQRNGKDLT